MRDRELVSLPDTGTAPPLFATTNIAVDSLGLAPALSK